MSKKTTKIHTMIYLDLQDRSQEDSTHKQNPRSERKFCLYICCVHGRKAPVLLERRVLHFRHRIAMVLCVSRLRFSIHAIVSFLDFSMLLVLRLCRIRVACHRGCTQACSQCFNELQSVNFYPVFDVLLLTLLAMPNDGQPLMPLLNSSLSCSTVKRPAWHRKEKRFSLYQS